MEWLTKIISHMAGAELFIQIIIASLMDNGKMENGMDTFDALHKMVTSFNQNGKMVSL
jgi:hypothetical protein